MARAMSANERLHPGRRYLVYIGAHNTCDSQEMWNFINNSQWCRPCFEPGRWSTEEIEGGWRTAFLVDCNLEVKVSDFMAYCVAGATAAAGAAPFSGGIGDGEEYQGGARSVLQAILNVPADTVAAGVNIVKGGAKAAESIARIPLYLSMLGALGLLIYAANKYG